MQTETVKIQNETRVCWCFEVVASDGSVGHLRVGDRETNDRWLGGEARDEQFLPNPEQVITRDEFLQLRPVDRATIRTLAAKGDFKVDGDISEAEAA